MAGQLVSAAVEAEMALSQLILKMKLQWSALATRDNPHETHFVVNSSACALMISDTCTCSCLSFHNVTLAQTKKKKKNLLRNEAPTYLVSRPKCAHPT